MKPHEIVQIALVDAPTITHVNETYLGHKGSTDVITFDYRDDLGDEGEEEVAADVLVCLDVAREAAAEHDTTFSREVVLYCVHGLLHLTGYDDHSDEDRQAMRTAEKRCLDALSTRWDLDSLFAPVPSAGLRA
jgi:probable rRNA maturation factor